MIHWHISRILRNTAVPRKRTSDKFSLPIWLNYSHAWGTLDFHRQPMFYHIVYHVFSICFLKTVLFHHFSTGFAASRSPLRWPLLRKMPVQRSGIWMAGMPKDGDPKMGDATDAARNTSAWWAWWFFHMFKHVINHRNDFMGYECMSQNDLISSTENGGFV